MTRTPAGPVQVRWNLADRTAIVFPQLATIYAVNGSGWLAGARNDPNFLAVLTTEAGDLVLPGLVEPVVETYVRGVSDDGRTLAGYAGDKEDELRAVVWTCT